MPIRLTIIVEKGVAKIRTDWKNAKNRDIKDFCKLLLNLQHGQCSAELIESVSIQGNKTRDFETTDKIVKQLMKQENFMDSPIVSPEEVGQEIIDGD